MHALRSSLALASLVGTVALAAACAEDELLAGRAFGGAPGPGVKWTGGPGEPGAPTTAAVGARRLTKAEYAATLRTLIAPEVPVALEQLAVDEGVPFDNDIALQHASGVLVEGADAIAEAVAAWVMTQPAVKARLYGCQPTGAKDAACFRTFVERFGRRAFRRPLTEAEITSLLPLHAASVEDNAFDSGAALALRAMLSHPSLLYRFEAGASVDAAGEVTLTAFEIAARLSFLLQGTTPDDALLDAAAKGELEQLAPRTAAAERLLGTPEAKAHLQRFHAMWLGYSRLTETEALARSMRAESDALVGATLFEGSRDYAELFRSPKTWLDGALATHYGLPAPSAAGGAWVETRAPERRGILSHGAVLSYGSKNGDTSPTRRGIFIRTRLMCQAIPPPPPTVNADQGPKGATPNACKTDRYKEHASGSCAGCHQSIDPVGFGLERYDALGRYRTHDDGRPECAVSGQGELSGASGGGAFQGPAALGELVLNSGKFEECVAEKLYTFALGRELRPEDFAMIKKIGPAFAGDGRHFVTLVRELVSDYTFTHRREEK